MLQTELYRTTLIITCVNVILHPNTAIQMLNYIGSCPQQRLETRAAACGGPLRIIL